MARIRDYRVIAEPVGPDVRGSSVFERFRAEPDTLAIAVVDDAGQPLGLIERNAFTLKMAAEFGRALYARRPVTALMDPAPLVVDGEMDAATLFENLDNAALGGLLGGFIVTESGRYSGVGSGVQLLQAASALARASSRAKSEFLAVMSHEIRTPLNGVLGVAALMERELTQEDLRPHVRTILDSGQGLLRLLNDALDMSRADAGALTLEPQPLDLTGITYDLKALWRARAEEKSITLSVTCENPDEVWVLGDEVRIKQVLNNLIGNALKFTPSGEVRATLKVQARDHGICVEGQVDDSGPGIPADRIEQVFQPFNTGEEGREGAGAGMGLAICRQIVERMGGQISAHRSEFGGASFRFTLELKTATPEHRAARQQRPEPTAHDSLHVLVADDHPTNRFVAGKLLEMFGCSHEAVQNGAEAVDAVRNGAFDLVLMDIKMPVMDGVAATRAIRTSGPAGAALPILALTANADEQDARTYLAAGMNAVVSKPIQPDILLDAIRRAMNAPALEQAA